MYEHCIYHYPLYVLRIRYIKYPLKSENQTFHSDPLSMITL